MVVNTPFMATEPSQLSNSQRARRIRIVETAMRLAGEGGYDAVQMRTVAEQSGVALGTIYRYFAGKDEVLLAGLVGWLRLSQQRLSTDPLPGGDPAERLAVLLERSATTAVQRPRLMGALVTALGTTSPLAVDPKRLVEQELREIITTALGVDSGVDSEGIARVLGHVWLSSLTRWVSGMAPAESVGAELQHAAKMMVSAMVRA
jgi:AcrR family transcriptional regulator